MHKERATENGHFSLQKCESSMIEEIEICKQKFHYKN